MHLLSALGDTRRSWLVVALLRGIILVAWFAGNARTAAGNDGCLTSCANLSSQGVCSPSTDVVPGQDGTELFVSINDVESYGTVCLYTHPWATQPQHCCTHSPCVLTIAGLSPGQDASVSISLTSTYSSEVIMDILRAYVPALTGREIASSDGSLVLNLVNTDTLPSEAYITIAPACAPVAALPGQRLLGSAYSVRASGALISSERPMSLRLAYDGVMLAGTDPHTLAVFAWDPYRQQWRDLGGQLFYDQQVLAVTTSRFTSYALMATPSWRDGLDKGSALSLAESSNVAWSGMADSRMLILETTPGEGSIVSRPITPTTSFANWHRLTFTYTAAPPTTTLAVHVLGLDGTPILTGTTNGIDLTHLDAGRYPALRLRVEMASTVVDQTPVLESWQLGWQAELYTAHLPMVLKED